ncbi:hypothetical protein ACH5RR_009767 [Cinchona calisaya]|uniref:Uncharacterized protein n=1 Tax=Cinchona calisaya TaxID=153742 RepID=A0ABD3AI30_9GENT
MSKNYDTNGLSVRKEKLLIQLQDYAAELTWLIQFVPVFFSKVANKEPGVTNRLGHQIARACPFCLDLNRKIDTVALHIDCIIIVTLWVLQQSATCILGRGSCNHDKLMSNLAQPDALAYGKAAGCEERFASCCFCSASNYLKFVMQESSVCCTVSLMAVVVLIVLTACADLCDGIAVVETSAMALLLSKFIALFSTILPAFPLDLELPRSIVTLLLPAYSLSSLGSGAAAISCGNSGTADLSHYRFHRIFNKFAMSVWKVGGAKCGGGFHRISEWVADSKTHAMECLTSFCEAADPGFVFEGE